MKNKAIKKGISLTLTCILLFTTLFGIAGFNLKVPKAQAAAANLIDNPGFEDGLEGWNAGSSGKFSISNEEAHGGSYSLKLTSASQDWDSFSSVAVDVVPNSEYTLQFYGKGQGNVIFKALDSGFSESLKEGTTVNVSEQWTLYSLSFNSKSYSNVIIYLSDSVGNAYFDDFSLTKNPTIPANGDFETGDLSGWSVLGTNNKFSVTDAVYHSGDYSLKITSNNQGWADSLYQSVPISTNTNYTLTFNGKGPGNTYYKIMTSDWSSILAEGSTSNTDAAWTPYTISFSSGSNSGVVIYLSDTNADAYFDDFLLAKSTVKPAEPVEPINNRTAIETSGFDVSPVNLVDSHATGETASLFAYLKNISGNYVMFGHQNDTTERVSDQAGVISDTYNNVNAYPAVFGMDMGDVMRSGITDTVSVIKAAYEHNGTITLSDHMPNFTSGGSYSDLTPTIAHILPGGKDNAKFLARLDATAELAKKSVDDNGNLIPIIYRPFHENSGIWFWWGASNSTKSEFIRLWRYTVEYLRDVKGVNNFLYAYSPNGHFTDDMDYLSRYPGDDYVDILGFDMYNDNPQYDSGWMEATLKDARIVAGLAAARDKVSALTETGPRWDGSNGLALTGNTMPDWYNLLHQTLTDDPVAQNIAYMMTWRNQAKNGGAPSHFWVPFKGDSQYGNHEMLYNFVEYYNTDSVLFADRVQGQYNLKVDVENKAPSAYIMAPGMREKVKGLYTLKVKVLNYDSIVEDVSLTVDNSAPLHAILDNDGYYSVNWDTTKITDGLVTVKAIIRLNTGELVDSSVVTVQNATDVEGRKPSIIDDFETYNGDTALLREEWLRNSNGDINNIKLVPDFFGTDQGYAMNFKYNLESSGYTGISKTVNADWSESRAVGLDFQGDGLGQDILLQISSGGYSFEAHLNNLQGFNSDSLEPQSLEIPFDSFLPKSGGTFNPASVASFALYVNAVNGAKVTDSNLYIDNLHLLSALPEWPADSALATSGLTRNEVTLHWPKAEDYKGIDAYGVYMGDRLVAELGADTTFFTVKDLQENTAYSFEVKARNLDGKWSAVSLLASIKTLAGEQGPAKNIPPYWVAGSVINVTNLTQNSLSLSWPTAIDDNSGVTYVVYQDNQFIAKIIDDSTTYNVTGLSAGTEYLYKIRAVDAHGLASSTDLEVVAKTISANDGSLPVQSTPSSNTANEILLTTVSLDNGVTVAKASDNQTSVAVDISQLENIPLNVEIGSVQLLLSASLLQQLKSESSFLNNAILNVKAEPLAAGSAPAGLMQVGREYEIQISVIEKDGKQHILTGPFKGLELTLDYEPKGTDAELIGIYYKNEATNSWEYVGGELLAAGQITSPLAHLSKYAVLQYNKVFNDVSTNHWAARAIQVLAAKSIIQGVSKTSFAPNNDVTRAEFISMLAHSLKLSTTPYVNEFIDVKASDWYAEAMVSAYKAGWVLGDGKGSVHPDTPISRAEMAVIAGRAMNLSLVSTGKINFFKDEGTLPVWAVSSVHALMESGLIKGYADGSFAPSNHLSRAEAAVFIQRILNQ
ncbi:glycosyl hydrolase [Paenibacillus sp. FSL L8-0333]|uniref:glycosyl hydrolase n=1 Tax=unclassified Paenibacillus TaxID=185978 RepID=UPI0030D54B42